MAWEGVEVHGTFNAQRFCDVLAKILSEKYEVDITITAPKEDEQDNKEVV